MKGCDCEKKLVKVGNYAMTGRVLGKGHFARVQEASHIHLNVKVAVKVLTFREVKDEYVIKNMRREARILAKVSHPNIIFLFETITTTKRYYIITELVNGGDLCTYITSQRTGKLDERQTRLLARQIISAVAHLHERGIVHRDLKMENILLDNTKENVKLVDFGLSNYRRGEDLLSTHCGSPEYAAPELYISGRQYGPEVDIWSLGVIFYGMLVGKLPFQSWHKPGLTPEAKRKQLIRETKVGLTHRHHLNLVDVSLLFRNLIERMLCPNPEERITMMNLQAHAWIYGRFHREYPQLDASWKRTAVARIGKMCRMTAADVCRAIETKRYSPLAGIYNIAKLHELQRRIEAESLKKDNRDQKKKPIQVELTKPTLRSTKDREYMSLKNIVITGPTALPLKSQNLIVNRRPGTVPATDPNDTRSHPQPKTPFTLGNTTTAPQKRFTMGFGAAISKILQKHKTPTKETPPPMTQPFYVKGKEVVFDRKSFGIPMHTAARAAARAGLETKRAGRKQ